VARRRSEPAVFHLLDHSDGHLAAITPSARTVITCHDLILLRAREGQVGFRPRARSIARFAWSTSFLRRVARVVCGSEATKADVVRLRGVAPERVAVVPWGVGERFVPLGLAVRERVRSQLGLNGPAVLHVDSGQRYKNPAATLRVLARLRGTGLEATLVRVGPPLAAAERALAEHLRIAGAVKSLGRVSDERLIEVYTAADVLLFPSHAEGFGWPVLEAMACGTPVVTSRAPALEEIAGDAGLRADADDVDGLAAAVSTVLGDPGLAERLRRRGRERAARHRWSRTADGYADVYASVAGGAP
jgi:glycosyltransferase involved in cell wall biosynthesis